MLILRLSKREDQALILISTILKFSALIFYLCMFATQCGRHCIIQAINSVRSNNISLKID